MYFIYLFFIFVQCFTKKQKIPVSRRWRKRERESEWERGKKRLKLQANLRLYEKFLFSRYGVVQTVQTFLFARVLELLKQEGESHTRRASSCLLKEKNSSKYFGHFFYFQNGLWLSRQKRLFCFQRQFQTWNERVEKKRQNKKDKRTNKEISAKRNLILSNVKKNKRLMEGKMPNNFLKETYRTNSKYVILFYFFK